MRWITGASRIEAYREEFDIDPNQLRQAPTDSIQHRQWSQAIDTPRRLEAAMRRAVREPRGHVIEAEIERGIEHDFGPEL